jgi:hypothetical protein
MQLPSPREFVIDYLIADLLNMNEEDFYNRLYEFDYDGISSYRKMVGEYLDREIEEVLIFHQTDELELVYRGK